MSIKNKSSIGHERPDNLMHRAPVRKKQRASMQSKHSITPWKDWNEFIQVSEGLKSALSTIQNGNIVLSTDTCNSSIESIDSALSTVQIWRDRTNNTLPLAIETSSCLALLLRRDVRHHCQEPSRLNVEHQENDSVLLLQMAYASSIIRGISGLSDSLQQDRASAAPMSVLCQRLLGIPIWLVDVRHDATHNRLPSIGVLRLAAHSLLGFFCERYWDQIVLHRRELMDNAIDLIMRFLKNDTEEASLGEEQGIETVEDNHCSNRPDEATEPGEEESQDEPDWLQTNYFSALYLPKKQPKKNKNKEMSEETKKCGSAKPIKSDPFVLLDQLVTDIPQDVVYDAAFHVLTRADYRHEDNVLGAESLDDGDMTLTAPIDAQVEALLLYLSRLWPGFLEALLTYLLDRASQDPCCKVWAVFLTDNKWLQQYYTKEEDSNRIQLLSTLLLRLDKFDDTTGGHDSAIEELKQHLRRQLGTNAVEVKVNKGSYLPWALADNWEPCSIGAMPC